MPAVSQRLVQRDEAAIRVDEDGAAARFHFPRSDVRMETLQRSDSVTKRPFKGSATCFDVDAGGEHLADAAWTYEDPYDEHADLAQRVAFDAVRFPKLRIQAGDRASSRWRRRVEDLRLAAEDPTLPQGPGAPNTSLTFLANSSNVNGLVSSCTPLSSRPWCTMALRE